MNYPERNEKIYTRRIAGETFRALADEYEITPTRVMQIFAKERTRRLRLKNDPLTDLPTKIKNICMSLGLSSKEAIIDALKTGLLDPRFPHRPKHYGWETHQQLVAWLGLGLNDIELPPRVAVECPYCKKPFFTHILETKEAINGK